MHDMKDMLGDNIETHINTGGRYVGRRSGATKNVASLHEPKMCIMMSMYDCPAFMDQPMSGSACMILHMM
jgi:hypothetical protein